MAEHEQQPPAESSTNRLSPKRKALAVGILVLAAVGMVASSIKTPGSNDRGGGEEACVHEAGSGRVMDSDYDDGSIFAVGVDEDDQTWTCRGTWIDDEWSISITPGG
jgi:hypothetical protein